MTSVLVGLYGAGFYNMLVFSNALEKHRELDSGIPCHPIHAIADDSYPPVATGRPGCELHSLHEPGYKSGHGKPA